MNNLVWLVFDSARYDAFVAAHTPVMNHISMTDRRWSYASWTAPSHLAFLMGAVPHHNKPGLLASTQYADEILRWAERLAIEGSNTVLRDFVPPLSLPAFLAKLGYRCEAYVSLPVLNPQTVLSAHFHTYELMPEHNHLEAILQRLEFSDEPSFFFLNTGETHYPYTLHWEDASNFPRIPGLNGVWRNPQEGLNSNCEKEIFNPHMLRTLWHRQVAAIEYLDTVVAKLLEFAPENTWFIITSDHGELFGEDGLFGHGPICHDKVFEVFFLEGQHPGAC